MIHNSKLKVALVHDYIKEYGGAERVLRTLADMYPDAPIYTAFSVKNSTAEKEFRDREIKESCLAPLLKIWRLYSPLRFLIPIIWGTMDLSDYDLVITSASWYITRGLKVGKNTKVVCYCHTPPRWLYGYDMSVGFTKYLPVKIYAALVGHFLRIYDFRVSQKINYWIANSKNVQKRIQKFYRKDSVVIYPPVDVKEINKHVRHAEFISASNGKNKILKRVQYDKSYFLIVSRLVGAKGLDEAATAARKLNFRLKIIGESHGFADIETRLKKLSGGNIELLGRIDDISLYHHYTKAKGFIALARDEDFGITPIESMAAGTPVIAYNGGGFRESVIDDKTGVFISDTSIEAISDGVKRFKKIKWDKKVLQKQAEKFSKERFVKKFGSYISKLNDV